MKWFSAKANKKSTAKTDARKTWSNDISADVLEQVAGGRMAVDGCHQMCKPADGG